MKFFRFLMNTTSYTAATGVMLVILGIVVVIFSFFLSSSFLIFSFDQINQALYSWLPIAVGIPTFFMLAHYGLLTPLKIPSFVRSFRSINSAYADEFSLTKDEMTEVYSSLTDMPMFSMMISVLYAVVMGAILAGIVLFQYKFSGVITLGEATDILRITLLAVVLIIVLQGMSGYLFTELITGQERAYLYNQMLVSGIRVRPRPLIGIRVKFFFFIILMIITLLTYAALMEKSRFYDESNINLIISYFALSVLAGLTLMQLTSSSILRVLVDIRRVTSEISSGGRSGFQVLALERELASIEYALMEMAWEIDDHRKNLENMVALRTEELQMAMTDLKSKDDQMQKQLDMASVIQRSILPGDIDDWNELKFAVRYIAMEKIGGDFYDVYQLKDDKLGIIIADVSGHGIPASLVTTMAKISFGNAGARYDSPRRIFQEVNQNILDHVKTQDYLTCFMVSIDDEYNVIYSNASHQKAILLRRDQAEIELLDTGGLFIGAIEEARDSYSEDSTALRYGDRLILYTDGIPEALNEERKEYSNGRLEEAIIEYRHMQLDEYANALVEDVQNHIGNAAMEDDITLLVIELERDEAVDIIRQSRRMISSHQYDEAISILREGLERYPANQKILYNLSKNYFRIHNYPRAIEYIEKYIENDRRNKYAFYIGGAAHFQDDNFERALELLDQAVGLDANFVNAIFAMGMVYKKLGRMDDAEHAFARVVSIDPDNKMALFEMRELRK